ncbi:MAG: HXXEE domain-containing protein [Acidobacteriaceae bacterium]
MMHWNFGLAWIAFAIAVALHVADEARHDFLATYNPSALAIRRRLHIPFFPPVFTFRVWLSGLIVGVCLLLALSPLAFHGVHWIRVVALPLAILIGLGNGLGHIGGSLYYRRWMAGILSSPALLIAGTWLLWSACIEGPALF